MDHDGEYDYLQIDGESQFESSEESGNEADKSPSPLKDPLETIKPSIVGKKVTLPREMLTKLRRLNDQTMQKGTEKPVDARVRKDLKSLEDKDVDHTSWEIVERNRRRKIPIVKENKIIEELLRAPTTSYELDDGEWNVEFLEGEMMDPGNGTPPENSSATAYQGKEPPSATFTSAVFPTPAAKRGNFTLPVANSTGFDESNRVPRETNETFSALHHGKMHKIPPFTIPRDASAQLGAWQIWLRKFTWATEEAGITDQRQKVLKLNLMIGDEMLRLIKLRKWETEPAHIDNSSTFRFYDELVEKITSHFKSLTDPMVDMRAFRQAKQLDDESILNFELRLREMAIRAGWHDKDDMVKDQLLQGMKNRTLSRDAIRWNIDIPNLITMESRETTWGEGKENKEEKEMEDASASLVAAVNFPKGQSSKKTPYRGHPYEKPKQGESGGRPQLQPPRANQSYMQDKGICANCKFEHRRQGYCPAANKACRKCGEIGHFERACTKEIRRLTTSNTSEVNNSNVLYE